MARLQAVRSPTQQLLSRENSDDLDREVAAPHGGGGALERALQEAGGAIAEPGGIGPGGQAFESVILLDTLIGGSATSKGALQRR